MYLPPKPILLLFFVLYFTHVVFPQNSAYNFRHLTTSEGLSDGGVRCITQDKYGYIWLGTYNGLNRFNGYGVTVFQHSAKDKYSLPANQVTALLSDKDGNLWVGLQRGLYTYDFIRSGFNIVKGTEDLIIQGLTEVDSAVLLIQSNKGPAIFNKTTHTVSFLKDISKSRLFENSFNGVCVHTTGIIYLSTGRSIVQYNLSSNIAREIALSIIKDSSIDRIAIDQNGNLWASFGNSSINILYADRDFTRFHIYNNFSFSKGRLGDDRVSDIYIDKTNRMWFSSARSGIAEYDSLQNSFINFENDPLQPQSLVYNNLNCIFEDKERNLWVGTEGYGASYFNPAKNLFHPLLPSYNQSPTLPDVWCRAVDEDKNQHLWIGTANGLAMYDGHTNSYSVFKNVDGKHRILFSNSIRSVLCDDDLIWIGTAQGLNRYHISSGRMDFISDDVSLPASFFWSLLKDHTGNLWAGTRNGLFRKRPGSKFEDLSSDSILSKYRANNIRALFEDSQHRLWLGGFLNGVVMYDSAKKSIHQWNKGDSSLTSNSITSFAEDRDGIIWVSTTGGLNAIDKNYTVHQYTTDNGLHSARVSELMVDKENRIWIGSSNGLMMLDSARSHFKNYGLQDGLASLEFNDQAGFRMHDGAFIMPALKGLLLFNPQQYVRQQQPTDLYISSLKVSNKEFETERNLESLDTLSLQYNQNFFTLELAALNYSNPFQTWYGYKLEPFDKDWIYTLERTVNYTNVPGGHYVFHYKATTDPGNWNVSEKKLEINIGTVFYKTWWFILLVLIFAFIILYSIFRYRVRQKEEIHSLNSKTQSLEKEKAMVMYESLKQQLNPHFLFNSLSSLSSLIMVDQRSAKNFLDQMSKIYRYILKSRDTELVPLVEELKFVEVYIKLQQTRFSSGLRVTVNVNEEYYHLKIVPVTLQNLVENAIKHNITDEETPLTIELYDEKGYLVVRNTWQPKSHVETSNKHGLNNMSSLYNYLSSKPIQIDRDDHYFTVKIPLI